MKQPFDPKAGLIVVPTEFHGPNGVGVLRLALDTGANTTLVNLGPLLRLGYDPTVTSERVQITTASGVEFAARVLVKKFTALGRARLNFPVLGHTLPLNIGVDGLLGLDFLRGSRLAVNFQKGFVRLTA